VDSRFEEGQDGRKIDLVGCSVGIHVHSFEQ
jgi:hypothetical protein